MNTLEPFADLGVLSLEGVAELTGMSLRQLERDCRAGRIRHTHRGKLRGMTREQIRDMVAAYATGSNTPSPAIVDDEIEQARAASRTNSARRTRRAA